MTAAPSQHFSGRGLHDRNGTLWSSMVIRSERQVVFFSGDTGLTTEYELIRERLGPFDLVMLEVGAFNPAWGDIHLGPENALKAHALLGGGPVPAHSLGHIQPATACLGSAGRDVAGAGPAMGARLLMPRLGEPIEPARESVIEPWWRAVDGVERRPEPRTPAVESLPRAMPWPID